MKQVNYRRKLETVGAVQWTGDVETCEEELRAIGLILHSGMIERLDKAIEVRFGNNPFLAHVGSWILRHEDGRISTVTDKVFQQLYEEDHPL